MQPKFGMRHGWIIGNWQTEKLRIIEMQSTLQNRGMKYYNLLALASETSIKLRKPIGILLI